MSAWAATCERAWKSTKRVGECRGEYSKGGTRVGVPRSIGWQGRATPAEGRLDQMVEHESTYLHDECGRRLITGGDDEMANLLRQISEQQGAVAVAHEKEKNKKVKTAEANKAKKAAAKAAKEAAKEKAKVVYSYPPDSYPPAQTQIWLFAGEQHE